VNVDFDFEKKKKLRLKIGCASLHNILDICIWARKRNSTLCPQKLLRDSAWFLAMRINVLFVFFVLFLFVFSIESAKTSGVTFIRSPQPIVAPPGDRVVFECETNVPPERVVWLHNHVELSANNSGDSNRRSGRHVESEAASYRV